MPSKRTSVKGSAKEGVVEAAPSNNAQAALSSAYALILSFQHTIENACEGDHPDAAEVDAWLTAYERTLL